MTVRVRLAPSPTGYMHIGTLRNAIYNYVFAKQNNGVFYVRIEDTDMDRMVTGAYESLLEGLKWSGMNYTEGPDIGGPYAPYIQTERSKRHIEVAMELIERGHAYYCFCTKTELEEMRKMQEARGLPPQYDRRYRDFPIDQAKEWVAEGKEYVVRLKMPLTGDLICDDIVRGKVKFPAKDLDDCILLKSSGVSTYHLAAMVDDHDQGTTHIIRSEEWLPSIAKHQYLFQAMDWEAPKFAHLPLILNEDRTKMSKRKGDVSLDSYIQKGYLKEALINFLSLLGWTHPEQKEVFDIDELIRVFDLGKIHKAGAIFKLEKLNWINGQHIRMQNPENLMTLIIEHGTSFGYIADFTNHIEINGNKVDKDTFLKIIQHSQSKLTLLPEISEQMTWYFDTELHFSKDLFVHEKMQVTHQGARDALIRISSELESMNDWHLELLKEKLFALGATLGLSNGQLLWPLRVALSGLPVSPGAFELADILGKEETLRRIGHALKKLE